MHLKHFGVDDLVDFILAHLVDLLEADRFVQLLLLDEFVLVDLVQGLPAVEQVIVLRNLERCEALVLEYFLLAQCRQVRVEFHEELVL